MTWRGHGPATSALITLMIECRLVKKGWRIAGLCDVTRLYVPCSPRTENSNASAIRILTTNSVEPHCHDDEHALPPLMLMMLTVCPTTQASEYDLATPSDSSFAVEGSIKTKRHAVSRPHRTAPPPMRTTRTYSPSDPTPSAQNVERPLSVLHLRWPTSARWSKGGDCLPERSKSDVQTFGSYLGSAGSPARYP